MRPTEYIFFSRGRVAAEGAPSELIARYAPSTRVIVHTEPGVNPLTVDSAEGVEIGPRRALITTHFPTLPLGSPQTP